MRLGKPAAVVADGPPTVAASALTEGSIASRTGRATNVPMPRRNDRRGICHVLLIVGRGGGWHKENRRGGRTQGGIAGRKPRSREISIQARPLAAFSRPAGCARDRGKRQFPANARVRPPS